MCSFSCANLCFLEAGLRCVTKQTHFIQQCLTGALCLGRVWSQVGKEDDVLISSLFKLKLHSLIFLSTWGQQNHPMARKSKEEAKKG